jgi:hypothetical protein
VACTTALDSAKPTPWRAEDGRLPNAGCPKGTLRPRGLACGEGKIFKISPSARRMATHPKTSTGIGRGGRREGAGRPRGALGKRVRARELCAQTKAEGLELPVDRLLRRMNDPGLAEDYRDQLAAIVAPYTAPRLSAVSVTKRPAEMTDEEIARLLALTEEDMLRLGIGRDRCPRQVPPKALVDALVAEQERRQAAQQKVADDSRAWLLAKLSEMHERLTQTPGYIAPTPEEDEQAMA